MRAEGCGSILEKIRLNDLLATIGISSEDERIVCGIHEDSRRVGKDWIFISRLGMKGEGKAYVREALD